MQKHQQISTKFSLISKCSVIISLLWIASSKQKLLTDLLTDKQLRYRQMDGQHIKCPFRSMHISAKQFKFVFNFLSDTKWTRKFTQSYTRKTSKHSIKSAQKSYNLVLFKLQGEKEVIMSRSNLITVET